MHENKNDAPTSKVFYRPLEASIRWAGLLRYEQVILASVSSPMNLPQSGLPAFGRTAAVHRPHL